MGLSTWINMTLPHLHWLLTLYKCSKETEREADKHKRGGDLKDCLWNEFVCTFSSEHWIQKKLLSPQYGAQWLLSIPVNCIFFFFALPRLEDIFGSLPEFRVNRQCQTHKNTHTALWVCVFCSKCFVLIHMHLASYTTNRLINQHQAKPSNHFALWNESPKWALWCNSPHWNPRKIIYIWQRVYLYGVFKLSTHDWRAGGRNQFLQRGKAFSPQRGGT